MNTKFLFGLLFFWCIVTTAQEDRFLVLAKFDDVELAKQMEQKMVSKLKAKGYEALTTKGNIGDEDLQDEETFLAKISEMGITGLIAFTNPEINYRSKRTPSVSANVHTKPVKVGIFRVNVGGSVPIAGGTKTKQEVLVNAEFYNKKDSGPVFTKTMKDNLSQGRASLMENFSSIMLKELSRQKIIR